MPHVFDTGAGSPQRTRIRAAVVARLSGLLRSASPPGYLRAIKKLPRPYRGEGDVDGLDLLWHAFNGQSPAIGIALGAKSYSSSMVSTELQSELTVAVYVVSQHGGDLVAGRLESSVIAERDETADPGLDVMMEHVEELLLGQGLGVEGVNELRVEEEDIIATFGEVSISELRFKVSIDRTINPARTAADLITEIEHRLSSTDIPAETAGFDPLVTTLATLDPED